jgi:hypothetical protein
LVSNRYKSLIMKKLFLLFSIFLPYLVSAQGSFGGNAANNVTHMRYSAISVVTPVVNGDSDVCLMFNRADSTLYRWSVTRPSWVAIAGGGGGFSNPMTAQYDLIVGGTSGTPTRQAVGANNTFLGVNGSGVLGYQTATQTTAALNVFTTALNGLVPTPGSGGTTLYLRQDGTWDVPPGGSSSPGGSNTQVQYNNSSAFGGVTNATSDGTYMYLPTFYGGTGTSQTMVISPTSSGSATTNNLQVGSTTGLVYQAVSNILSTGFTAAAADYALSLKNATSGVGVGIHLDDNYGTGSGGATSDNYAGGLGKYGFFFSHNYGFQNGSFLNEASGGNQSKAIAFAIGGSSSVTGGFSVFTFANGSSTKLFPLYLPLPNTSGQTNVIVSPGLSSPSGNGVLTIAGLAAYNSTLGTGLVVAASTSNDAATAASGTVINMAANVLNIPTFSATNTAITYTNGATLWLSGAPANGTHVTITNPYALYVQAGNIAGSTTSNATFAHFVNNSPTPTIAAGAGAGTSPTVSISGTDQDGFIIITTGTSPTGSTATIVTVTYAAAFPTSTAVTLTPTSLLTANLATVSGTAIYTFANSTTFQLISNVTALAPLTQYSWYYHVGGY